MCSGRGGSGTDVDDERIGAVKIERLSPVVVDDAVPVQPPYFEVGTARVPENDFAGTGDIGDRVAGLVSHDLETPAACDDCVLPGLESEELVFTDSHRAKPVTGRGVSRPSP